MLPSLVAAALGSTALAGPTIPCSNCWNWVLPPDLTVSRIVDGGCVGGQVAFFFTVTNRGYSASPSTYLDVFFQNPTIPEVGDVSSYWEPIPSLAAGDSTVVSVVLPWWLEDEPTVYVDAIVDTAQSVFELDETNNVTTLVDHYPSCSGPY